MEKILGEKINENYEPTADEIINYAIWLGLTLPDDEDLLYIARESLKAPLPQQWKRCKTNKGDIYYFNFETGQSEQMHPYDSHHKQLVRKAKHLNEPAKLEHKTKASLLNYQVSIINDFNTKLKETENALNAIDTLKNKTAEILSRPINPELEMDFRVTSSAYQANSILHDPPLIKAYQDYLNAYQTKTSLYNFRKHNIKAKLFIYNTESETREFKIIERPESLDFGTCITQLPNGKLFCFGDDEDSGVTALVDVNGGAEVLLPSGIPCCDSSCIYFNNSVYCFGGCIDGKPLTLSNRFDLDQNRWIQLTPMPINDERCSSIAFKGNILISGFRNRNLLLYSIDINSFSKISYEFVANKRKILINAERLYLIECHRGSIYECEIGSYTNWSRIEKSAITSYPSQVYCSYNKGGIYIGCGEYLNPEYWKFDLNKKLISEL